MDNKVKAEIVTDFTKMFAGLEVYQDFFEYNDLGVPLAIAVESDLCELNDKGIEVLDETYSELLKAVGAEPGDYAQLGDIISSVDDEDQD